MGVIKGRGAVAAIALLVFLAWFINFCVNMAQRLAGAENLQFGIRQLFESFGTLSAVAPLTRLLT